MKRFMLILFVLVMITGCARLESGTIVSKRIKPKGSYPMIIYVNNMPITNIVYYPDRFYFEVSGFYKNKPLTEEHSVTKEVYESYRVGNTYRVDS